MSDTAADDPGADVEEAGPEPGLVRRVVSDQRFQFLVVGGINTALGIGWFALFQSLLGAHVGYMINLVLGHVCSVLSAFFLHRTFVFRVKGHFWLDLGRFTTVTMTNFVIIAVLLPVVVELVHVTPIAAQAGLTVLTVLISWFGHKYFSFRR